MAQIIDIVPNDTDMVTLTQSANQRKALELQHKKQVKKRLEDYLERQQLKQALGDDVFA